MAFVSGVSEMLIQSHEGVISLIPALPKAWDKGAFRGLHARGGFTLDVQWESYQVCAFTVTAVAGSHAVIELPITQKSMTFRDQLGNCYTAEDRKITVNAEVPLQLTAVE